MALKANCKTLNKTLKKVAPDEPIFVLRAQDKFAPALVLAWAELARAHGASTKTVREAYDCVYEMYNWPTREFPD